MFNPLRMPLFDAETDVSGGGGADSSANVDLGALLAGDSAQGANQNAEPQQDSTKPEVKPDKTFTRAEVNKFVEDRLHKERQRYQGFDQVQQQIQQLQQHGWTLDSLLAQLNSQAVQQQAEQYNLPPEVVQKLNDYDQRFQTFEQAEASRQLDSDADRLSKDPNLGEFYKANEVEILETAVSLGIPDLEVAAGKVLMKHYPQLAQQLTETGKQAAVRDIQGRNSTIVDTSTQGGGDNAPQLSADELAMAKALGVDPKNYAKQKKAK